MAGNPQMKKVLIVSPHFPPSNLAAVHRSRLFAMHLPSFGWEPVILMVDEKYYEEDLDYNLLKLVPGDLRVEKVKAFNVSKKLRMIGDIGLRGFYQLYRRMLKMCREEKFDFLYIPIPSFYGALLGRMVHAKTGIPYGIDYIDPWVHKFPGSEKKFSRAWFSTKLAKFLEPIAVKKASLITGVAEGYYKGVQERNPQLMNRSVFGAMPYGGEASDHEQVRSMQLEKYLFEKKKDKLQLVYAGAMLPRAYAPMEEIFKAINDNPEEFADVEFHFIGTGKSPNDPVGYNIRPLAEQYGLWEKNIFEYPRRIPYLNVLVHLERCDGVFILGSTEPHYTPSKVYQSVLSGKYLFAVLHSQSTAVTIIRQSNAGVVLPFNGEAELEKIRKEFAAQFKLYRKALAEFDPSMLNADAFNSYSAKQVTASLAALLDKATAGNSAH
ncbi:MAG: hypothetical protein WCF67_16380 [Chitinophagaceae bacterium]